MNKLEGQEMILKEACRKIISEIMEKTTVDFILVISSIYYCFFFQDLPLVTSDVDCI